MVLSYLYGGSTLGLLELLTLIFVLLKLTGLIAWSWWLVLLPAFIALAIYVIWISASLAIMYKASKVIKNLMK